MTNPARNTTSCGTPCRLASPAGLRAELNANGSLKRLEGGDIMLNVYLGNEVEGGPANLFLRRLGPEPHSIPLLGPRSPACYRADDQGLTACGRWGALAFRVHFTLAAEAAAWFWHVEVENQGTERVVCDLLHTQDLALAHYGATRLNEFYVCHYVDHTALEHSSRGVVVASRQNLSMGGHTPWTAIGSLGRGVGYATDALQFHGLATRAGAPPSALRKGLPGSRLQAEHSLVALQDEPFVLAPGARTRRGFFGCFQLDKPTPSSAADLAGVDAVLALPAAVPATAPAGPAGTRPAASLFTTAPFLEVLDLDQAGVTRFFGATRRHAEQEADQLLSFFTAANHHVVLRAKEREILRPHGHLLRSGSSLVPDEAALTSTAWMGGVFHSMVTQGHVSINRFLSTCHSYLGLFRSHGQRVFVEIGGAWRLLGLPSAFEMAPDSCRWIYRHPEGVIEVRASAPEACHELRLDLDVLEGGPVRFLISHHIALNGDDGSNELPVMWRQEGSTVRIKAVPECDVGRRFPEGEFLIEACAGTQGLRVGGDECLFADGATHRQPFLCLVTEPVTRAGLVLRGTLVEPGPVGIGVTWAALADVLHLDAPAGSPLAPAAERAGTIVPWFIHNALVHYLSPRGLEQYSGGGWGTRDVCQGPVELLLALGRPEPVRDLLLRVFRQQNPDGDWPQWFMFFDRERNIRPGDSHGDIIFWPLLALAQYLQATGEAAVLDETLPFFHPDGEAPAEKGTLLQHVDRALALITRRVIPGTVLAAYGHGDWNDSLQPAQPEMREHLCSAWTVTLNYQTLTALAGAFRQLGRADRACPLEERAAAILAAFRQILVVDDVLTGFAYFHEGGQVDYLLHPRDQASGPSCSVLAIIHALINDMFTPQQAERHLALIRDRLTGPDGVHLFDRPIAYQGGVQTRFQRAETSSYPGREIGNMYMHAHLRSVEALARHGDAEAFFQALARANPIALREIVPTAALRQANCYSSSTDPAFADRYEAYTHYDRVNRGEVKLEGGWRVYSSGAGIGVRLIVQCFLGLRREQAALVLDPVIPPALDGLTATVQLGELRLAVTYHVQARGCGPLRAELNGRSLATTREPNAYRTGALRVAPDSLQAARVAGLNRLEIWLG